MVSFSHQRSGRVSSLLILSVLANLGLGVGAAYIYWRQSQVQPAVTGPVNRPPSSSEAIESLGRVQPISGVINVFGPPGDQLLQWSVQLGSPVKAGELLGQLSGEEERRRGLAALDAQITEAQTLQAAIRKSRDVKLADVKLQAEQALKSGEFDLQVLQAKILGLQEQLAQVRIEEERLKKIELDGVPVSAQEREQVRLLLTKAEQELNATVLQRAKAEQLKASADQTTASSKATIEAETERALAQVPLLALQASRRVAEQKLLDAQLKAPIAGEVVKLSARAGETITTMPIAQVADTSQMLVIAEVYETDVPRLRDWLRKSGQPVTVEIDARVLPDESQPKLVGTTTLERIAPMIAKNAVFALGPREDADRRVVEVEVLLDAASSAMLRQFIGLQVRARFLPPK